MPLFGFPFLGRSGGGLGEVFYKHFPSRNPFLHGLSERFGEVGRSFSKFHLFEDCIAIPIPSGVRFLQNYLEVCSVCIIFAAEKKKGSMMDKRFTPRTNEEMLAAVRAFQERQKAMYDRLDTKLKKEIYQEEMA
jgi:hypothetical protein